MKNQNIDRTNWIGCFTTIFYTVVFCVLFLAMAYLTTIVIKYAAQ